MTIHGKIAGLVLFVSLIALFVGTASAGSVTLITKEELLKKLDDPNLVILDVRTGRDWKSSEFKIKGASKVNAGKLNSWIGEYSKDKLYVTYCA